MRMNGRDCVKCQNQDKMGHDGNYGIVNEKETKSQIVVFSNGKQKKRAAGKTDAVGCWISFLERECAPFL